MGPPAGPRSAPFTQCPPIGQDTSCQYLIDVTAADPARPTVLQDPTQHFYDGEDDVTVGVQNDTAAPLGSLRIGVPKSGDRLFEFDGDGLCWKGISPRPAECPFSAVSYDGPDTNLVPESADAGTVFFNSPLQPGQYTYFSLEAGPREGIVAGEFDDDVTTTLTNTVTHQEGDALSAPAPVAMIDRARVKGEYEFEASGQVQYLLYRDPSCHQLVQTLGTKAVIAGVAEASEPSSTQLPTNATYYWVAEYLGGGRNARARSACGSATMTFGSPPAPSHSGPAGSPSPSGLPALRLLSLHASSASGRITVRLQTSAAGAISVSGFVLDGASLAGPLGGHPGSARPRRCARGYAAVHARCISNAPVRYGSGVLASASAGTYTLVLGPAKRVLQALHRGRTLKVTVTAALRPSSGAAPTPALGRVLVRLRPARHRR